MAFAMIGYGIDAYRSNGVSQENKSQIPYSVIGGMLDAATIIGCAIILALSLYLSTSSMDPLIAAGISATIPAIGLEILLAIGILFEKREWSEC